MPEKQPLSTRKKALIVSGGVAVLALVVYLFLSTQGKIGNGGRLETILRDFGHVVREVKGPGLVR